MEAEISISRPEKKKLIILGSSRREGDTGNLVKQLMRISDWDMIDLNDFNFTYYDYKHQNREDDFIPLIKKITGVYDVFLFATPVYWYSMSGIMKVFFDRITDLLEIEKNVGRKFRGKKMAAISCSIGNNLGDNFWLPFSETANYLGMEYLGNLHTIPDQTKISEIETFMKRLNDRTGK